MSDDHLKHFFDVYDSERAEIIARVGSLTEAREYIAAIDSLAGRRILVYETACVIDEVIEPASSTPSPLLVAPYPDEQQQPYSGPESGRE